MKPIHYYQLKEIILQKIQKNGGWVNCHAHLDRAFTITDELFKLANKYRHEKWKLNAEIRKNSSVDQIYSRMAKATELLVSQNVTVIGSFIDIDSDIKDKAIRAASKVRETYKSDVTFKFINSYSNLSEDGKEWFTRGAEFVDIVGGILKIAEGKEYDYLATVLETAKKYNKIVHMHIDELNTPIERETEILANATIEHDMVGKVVGIHAISLNAHPKDYRNMVYNLVKEAQMMIVTNPMAWLNARRSEIMAPIHNPIAPIDEMLANSITVGIGVDNIADLFMPLSDGIIWNDMRALIEENRLYDIEEIVKIATVNGRKILGMPDTIL